MNDTLLDGMRQSILDGAPQRAAELARQALATGMDPLHAIDTGYLPGMSQMGEQFGAHQVFLPDLMAASEAMKAALAVLEPELKRTGTERPTLGTVVLGSAKGDIHEIGKGLVGTLLAAHGFRVHDLGVDVATEVFVAKAHEFQADMVGISALLTTTMRAQQLLVEAMDREGLRPRVKVVIGGAPVTRRWAEEIGADGFGKDAMSAVRLARELLAR